MPELGFSVHFLVQEELHQTSMLSFLLSTAVLKVLPRAIRPGFLDELLYVHDLTVISEKGKLKAWTVALESNRLSINANKTKI